VENKYRNYGGIKIFQMILKQEKNQTNVDILKLKVLTDHTVITNQMVYGSTNQFEMDGTLFTEFKTTLKLILQTLLRDPYKREI
jgi:hypothetical protein